MVWSRLISFKPFLLWGIEIIFPTLDSVELSLLSFLIFSTLSHRVWRSFCWVLRSDETEKSQSHEGVVCKTRDSKTSQTLNLKHCNLHQRLSCAEHGWSLGNWLAHFTSSFLPRIKLRCPAYVMLKYDMSHILSKAKSSHLLQHRTRNPPRVNIFWT